MTRGDLLMGLVVSPLLGSIVAILGKLLPWKRLFAAIAMSFVAVNGILVAMLFVPVMRTGPIGYDVGGWPVPYGIALRLDGLAWLASALIVVISVAACLSSYARHRDDPRYYFFLLLLIAGMQGVVVTTDLFNMFVCFEIVAIAAYVLIAYEQTATGLVASLKYLILSTVGILFFLFGILIVYRDLGTLSFIDVSRQLSARPGAGGTGAIHLGVAALCVGIGVRTAFIPFHTWMPEAHAYAPHPVSAMLSGVLIKVSFMAMVRVLTAFRAHYLDELFLWIGAITAVVAVIWALSQSDAKRLLAYHSISQMGYILAAFGSFMGSSEAIGAAAAASHAVNHALFKSLLFLTVGTAVDVGGSRDLYRIAPLGRRHPLLAVTFFVGALSIAGIPPFNGYASKQLISAALAGSPAYALLWATGVGTAASFIKLSRIFCFRNPRSSAAPSSAAPSNGSDSRVPVLLSVSAVLLAALCAATGLLPRTATALYAGLLGDSVSAVAAPSFFSWSKLSQTALATGIGVGVYFLATAKIASPVTRSIRRLAPDIEMVLVFFFAGLALFGAVAYL